MHYVNMHALWFVPSIYNCELRPSSQKPVRRSLCRSIRKNFHWKCFLLTLFIDGCFVYIFWCRFSYSSSYAAASYTNNYESGPCSQGYNFIPVAFGIMLYVVYIMECWHCKTRLDMVAKTDATAVLSQIEKLRAAMPVVWWRAVCYHYVRRTRQVTRYRNGDAVTTTQVYYERINAHTAGAVFLYHDCGVKDISKTLVNLTEFPIVKIRFSKGFVFANLQSANEFEEQRTRFFQENEMRDDYMEVREGLDLTDCTFRDYVICYCKSPPWYTRQAVFWLCSLLLCSWPLRVFIETRTAYVHYQVTKLFGTNYLSPTSQNYTGPLTRASTMDSADLDSAIRGGYVIVPSYSQALLMDPVGQTAGGQVALPDTVKCPVEWTFYSVWECPQVTGSGTVMRDARSGLVTVQRGLRPPVLQGTNMPNSQPQNNTIFGSREHLFLHVNGHQNQQGMQNEHFIVPNYGALNESNAGSVPIEQLAAFGGGANPDMPGATPRPWSGSVPGTSGQQPWPTQLRNLWSWLIKSQNVIGANNRVNDNSAVVLEQLRRREHPPRSRSLNWLRGSAHPAYRPSTSRPPAVLASQSYHTLPNTPEEGDGLGAGDSGAGAHHAVRHGANGVGTGRRWNAVVDGVYATGDGGSALYPEEPPPPYEMAVRMCAPLYERIRRSASSLHRYVHWPVTARSSGKEPADTCSVMEADSEAGEMAHTHGRSSFSHHRNGHNDYDDPASVPMLPENGNDNDNGNGCDGTGQGRNGAMRQDGDRGSDRDTVL